MTFADLIKTDFSAFNPLLVEGTKRVVVSYNAVWGVVLSTYYDNGTSALLAHLYSRPEKRVEDFDIRVVSPRPYLSSNIALGWVVAYDNPEMIAWARRAIQALKDRVINLKCQDTLERILSGEGL